MRNQLKKVLIHGSNHVSALERIYLKYLLKKGVSAQIYPAQDRFLDYYNRSVLTKLIFRSGLSSIYQSIDTEFKILVENFRPDVVWVFKGMELLPDTIDWLKKRKIIVVNYNPDNPYIFSGRGSGNSNVTRSIKLFDLYMTYDNAILRRLEDDGIRAALIAFGFDIPPGAREKAVLTPEVAKACFIGGADEPRSSFLNQLAVGGIPLDIYGNGWEKFKLHHSITVYPPVYEDEFWITMRRYRAQVNMLRIHNLASHNMRSFDVPAIGGIQLAPFTSDHNNFFIDGKEIFLYRNVNHCISLITELLNYSNEQISDLRRAAEFASFTRKYSYKDRLEQILIWFNQLYNNSASD